MKRLIVMIVCGWWGFSLAAMASGAPKEAVLPERNGFTLEIGIGIGGILASPGARDGGHLATFGFEAHSLSLGGFVTPRWALMYRYSSANYITTNARGDIVQGLLGIHGLHTQYWLSNRWFVAGGVGGAFFGNGFGRLESDPPIIFGLGLVARVGFTFAYLKNHAWSVTFKVATGIFAERVVVGQTLNVEYQWF